MHAQQGAERSLRALLAAHDLAFRRARDLQQLVDWRRQADPGFPDFAAAAHLLNPYAAWLEDPIRSPNPSVAEAGEAIRLGREITHAVSERLSSGGTP